MNSPLHDQLATIERELATLDFDAAHERARLADAELARLGGAKLQDSASRPTSPPGSALTGEQLRAAGLAKQARAELSRLDARAAELCRQAAGIARLLNSGERIAATQADVKSAQQAAAASAGALANAEAASARLAAAIEAEKRDAAEAVEASAAAMLEAARTGADAGSVAVRPDRLGPLQAAMAAAEAERDRSKAQHATDSAAVTAAQRRVREAEADASQAEYEAAEAAFVALAAQHVRAVIAAGRGAPAFLHLHDKAHAAARLLKTTAP